MQQVKRIATEPKKQTMSEFQSCVDLGQFLVPSSDYAF
jgi:hypothetical protein